MAKSKYILPSSNPRLPFSLNNPNHKAQADYDIINNLSYAHRRVLSGFSLLLPTSPLSYFSYLGLFVVGIKSIILLANWQISPKSEKIKVRYITNNKTCSDCSQGPQTSKLDCFLRTEMKHFFTLVPQFLLKKEIGAASV